jgi:hypothetical protein
MTQLLQEAFERVRLLTEVQQNALAKTILELADIGDVSDIVPPEHMESVFTGLAQLRRGEFATDEEMKAVFERFKR